MPVEIVMLTRIGELINLKVYRNVKASKNLKIKKFNSLQNIQILNLRTYKPKSSRNFYASKNKKKSKKFQSRKFCKASENLNTKIYQSFLNF